MFRCCQDRMSDKAGSAFEKDASANAKPSQDSEATKGAKQSQSSSGPDGYGGLGAQGLSQLSDLSQLEAQGSDPKTGSGHMISLSQLASGGDGLPPLEPLSQVMLKCAVHDAPILVAHSPQIRLAISISEKYALCSETVCWSGMPDHGNVQGQP